MRVLITGASGFVGSQLGLAMSADQTVLGITLTSNVPLAFPTQILDITLERAVADLVREFRPEVIVHAAAHSRVLACESNPERTRAVNVTATGCLVRWAERIKARIIYLSSDQIFSGKKGAYIESDLAQPVNEYGRSKVAAEELVLSNASGNLVIRSNSVVGRSDGHGESFSDWILNHLQRGKSISLFQDQYRSPIHIRVLVRVIREVCLNPLSGIIHVGGPHRISRADLGFLIARAYGLSADPIEVTSVDTHPQAAIMTRDTSFNIARLRQLMPGIPFRSLDEEFEQDSREAGATA